MSLARSVSRCTFRPLFEGCSKLLRDGSFSLGMLKMFMPTGRMLIMSKAMMDETEDFTDFDVFVADDVDFVEHMDDVEDVEGVGMPAPHSQDTLTGP